MQQTLEDGHGRRFEYLRLSLTDVLQRAATFYRQQLRQSPQAIAYLKARGLTGEIAAHFGAVQSLTKDGQTPESAVAVQKEIAKFIAESLCNEDGTPLLTAAQAENIGPILKGELRTIVLDGSNKTVSELGNA